MWWFIPVILATQDSQMASLDKSTRFSLKKKLKQKGLCVCVCVCVCVCGSSGGTPA
jgi:hypothetical protein